MNKIYLILLALFLSTTGVTQQKKLCVTVDDLPVVSYGKSDADFLREVTTKLISTFNNYAIPAIGLC
ncbi:MAG: hypothetical protein AAF149_16790 [Bacteroidota bacterium]